MTDSFDNAPEPDARVQPPMTPPPQRYAAPLRRPSRAGRVLRWWLGISVLALVACVACIVIGVHQADFMPLHIVIDGDDISDGVTIQGISDGGKALLGVGALMLAALLVLLVPILVLVVLALVAFSVVVGIGVPLLVLAFALLVVTAPFWLTGLLVWLIVRDRRPRPRPAPSATMVA
jgi:hypothetical protein